MKPKELYRLSVKLSGGALRIWFGAPDDAFSDMEANASRKAARKYVFEQLAPLLLDKEEKPPEK